MYDLPAAVWADKPIEIDTGANPQAAIIWLHGLGADGQDFAPVIPELGLPKENAVRFIFPHAPKIPVTWNGGYVMRAWYDIVSIDETERHADEAGVAASCAYIGTLIAEQNARGIATDRIVIAGFSQGGAIAYTVALTYPGKLAGVIALSTYIPAPELVKKALNHANAVTPIFAGHGDADGVVSLLLGDRARTMAGDLGFNVEWHTYPMAHSVCLEELQDIGKWLNERFAATGRERL